MFRFHGKSSIKDEVLINLLISHLPTTTASHRVSTESVCSALSLKKAVELLSPVIPWLVVSAVLKIEKFNKSWYIRKRTVYYYRLFDTEIIHPLKNSPFTKAYDTIAVEFI